MTRTPDAAEALPPVNTRRLLLHALVLLIVTAGVLMACTLAGRISVTGEGVWLWRFYHLLAAAAVGAGLAVSGMALQGLLRNPLADPFILGISSGAGIGVLCGFALVGTVALPRWLTTPVLALAGALATCAVVYGIAQRRGRLDPYVLLLSGVIVNAFNGAIMMIIYFIAPQRTITDFTVWSMGGISDAIGFSADPADATNFVSTIALVAVAIAWAVLFIRGWSFNALGLGDDVAGSIGVSVHWLRVETFATVSIATAAAVALSGPVGFVGLIVPHICRTITGPDHRKLAVYSGFVGAMLLMGVDTLCRVVGPALRVGVIPVGVLTALCGGPFFIYLLRRRGRAAA